jgi:hypothetical protein
VVSQTGAVALVHCVLLVHIMTHVFVVVLQVRPPVHCVLVVHATQLCPVLQYGVVGVVAQFAFERQATQSPAVVSQYAVGAAHMALPVQGVDPPLEELDDPLEELAPLDDELLLEDGAPLELVPLPDELTPLDEDGSVPPESPPSSPIVGALPSSPELVPELLPDGAPDDPLDPFESRPLSSGPVEVEVLPPQPRAMVSPMQPMQ